MLSGMASMIAIRAKKATGGGGGSDVTPNAVNWSDMTYNDGTGEIGFSSKQITGINADITLGASAISNGGLYYKISDTEVTQVITSLTGYTEISSGGGNTAAVSNNKWVTFAYAGSANGTTVTIRNVTDGNAVLDTFQVFFIEGGCLLTSAMVGYFGLSDDCSELAAMRALRDHYALMPEYDAIIKDYYRKSPNIIAAIATAGAQDAEYAIIRTAVDEIKSKVETGDWRAAHDIYMAVFEGLKAKYL